MEFFCGYFVLLESHFFLGGYQFSNKQTNNTFWPSASLSLYETPNHDFKFSSFLSFDLLILVYKQTDLSEQKTSWTHIIFTIVNSALCKIIGLYKRSYTREVAATNWRFIIRLIPINVQCDTVEFQKIAIFHFLENHSHLFLCCGRS